MSDMDKQETGGTVKCRLAPFHGSHGPKAIAEHDRRGSQQALDHANGLVDHHHVCTACGIDLAPRPGRIENT